VISADEWRGILMIKGSVPGSPGGYVLVKDAAKRKAPDGLPFPAALRVTPLPPESPAGAALP
jgi:large subunit ribosomal protein L3